MNKNKLQKNKILVNNRDVSINMMRKYNIIENININRKKGMTITYDGKEINIELNNFMNQGIRFKSFKNLRDNSRKKTQDDIDLINNIIFYLSNYRDNIEREYNTALIGFTRARNSNRKVLVYDDFKGNRILLNFWTGGCDPRYHFDLLYFYEDNICEEVYRVSDGRKFNKETDYDLYKKYNYINRRYSKNKNSLVNIIKEKINDNKDAKEINKSRYKLEKPILKESVDKTYIKVIPELKEDIEKLNETLEEAYSINIINEDSIIRNYYIPEMNNSINKYDKIDSFLREFLKENIKILTDLINENISEYNKDELYKEKVNIKIMNNKLKSLMIK